MRLYRRDIDYAEKAKYLSLAALSRLKRDKRWGIVADDKLLTYALLSYQGIEVPKIHAIFHPVRAFEGSVSLRSVAELETYLLTTAPFPFFSKPIQSIFSQDAILVKSLDISSRTLSLGDGSKVALHEFAKGCSKRKKGYLLQELLHPHRKIAAVCGDRLSTVRMTVLIDEEGARLFSAQWKIAVPENMADNYWRKGNILALLDKRAGIVKRCTSGLGKEMHEVDISPATGKSLIGFVLPDWSEAVDLTLKAARALPGLPIQAWDIALTSKGPMALEVNVFGSPFLPQIAQQEGLYKGEFRAFMDAHRY
jgi:hypothetical protein